MHVQGGPGICGMAAATGRDVGAALPAEALYLPFEAGPHRMAMGLVARQPEELIALDDHYPAEMAERRVLLDGRHAEVFAATAGSDEARQETLDRFMRHLKPGKLAERLNWSVTDDPALFQLEGKHRTSLDLSVTPANAGERLFLRVERQTLSRLPRSGFVLFTIRVHSYPLSRVAAQPGAAARLALAVRAMPDAMAAYKSLPPFKAALLGFLDGSTADAGAHDACV